MPYMDGLALVSLPSGHLGLPFERHPVPCHSIRSFAVRFTVPCQATVHVSLLLDAHIPAALWLLFFGR